MRILHVVPSYLPAVRYGGPIFAVHGLCRALAARGHKLHVFTTNIDGPGITATPVATPVDLDGVQVDISHAPYSDDPIGRRPSAKRFVTSSANSI